MHLVPTIDLQQPIPTSHTMATVLTQSRTERSTGIYLRVKDERHLCDDCLENVGTSTSHKPMGLCGLLQVQLYLS
jgi:hypothetical protein